MTKVLHIAAECMPFAKTGGLADVIGTLPRELKRLGMDSRVMMPLHRSIKFEYRESLRYLCNFYLHIGWRSQYVGVATLELNGVQYYFIDNEYYFGGPIYKGGTPEGEQYAFFSRACLAVLEFIDFMPDVIHVNDWHTAVIPALIKGQYQGRPQGNIKTVLTIHNLRYQGKFGLESASDWLGLDQSFFTKDALECYGCANFMKGGIVFADRVTTVSPTYAWEILNPYFSEGLEGVLNQRAEDIAGILNGIDTTEFDPSEDPLISSTFDSEHLAGKQRCKEALTAELGINCRATTPLIGMVTRLTNQKGIDLIKCVFEDLMHDDIAFVILGSGDRDYESFFRAASYAYPGRVAIRNEYNNTLAHRIYAGCDFFLMPSLFEPCGISQMIAMRYGTLPIVRKTGGLADTISPYNQYTGKGNGFAFDTYNAHDMLNIIRMAEGIYWDKAVLTNLIKQAMVVDHSFTASAKLYKKLFDSLV